MVHIPRTSKTQPRTEEIVEQKQNKKK
jgi:hypothetical protein